MDNGGHSPRIGCLMRLPQLASLMGQPACLFPTHRHCPRSSFLSWSLWLGLHQTQPPYFLTISPLQMFLSMCTLCSKNTAAITAVRYQPPCAAKFSGEEIWGGEGREGNQEKPLPGSLLYLFLNRCSKNFLILCCLKQGTKCVL